tara:strand:- start:267 stop:488 length:222 start_codon:yes stop_codon:yes gene_type:complete
LHYCKDQAICIDKGILMAEITNFRLDDKERESLRVIGGGDMSRGLRIALWFTSTLVGIKKAYKRAVTGGFLDD